MPTRERFSLSERETETLLLSLQSSEFIKEVFALSTCNRTEVYCYGTENSLSIIKEKFAQLKSVSVENLIEMGFKSTATAFLLICIASKGQTPLPAKASRIISLFLE